MVDKVRQNLDVNEVSELNLESSRPQTLPESEERDDLLRDFSLEVLTDTSKSAFYEVKSKDEELGIPATNFALYGKNISHIPEIFRDLPEGKDLFNLIRRPSTDLRQIHQRQVIVEALIQNNDLDVLIGIKNSVYNVTQGIQLLFAPIDIDEYRKETALFAYRHGYEQRAHATVFQALQLLENGKAALAEFAKRLKADLSPFIRKIAETIEELNQSTEPFTRKYFLEDDYDESETTGCGYKVQKANGEIGMFLEFARVAKNDGYAKCTFDADKPFEYRQGWNLFRQKNGNCPQVPNDSPRHTPVTVYTGSNMSGKSFQMKTGFFMQLAGQTCGFAPCKSGNFGIYDSFHFLDRASTHHSINLSAFGVEVSDWNQTIEKFGRRPFVCCDEGWSTTSPEDQHSLIAGTDLYLRERSARVFFATHNEKFIQRHNDDQNVGLYHLQIDVAEDGKVKYHYRLRENRDAPAGAADSRAIDIGRALGLDPQLIELALAYLQGKSVDIEAAAKKTGRPIARYTEEDRERLKRQGYVQAPSQDRQCLILSEDSDFHASWYGGIDISDTYRRADRATKFMNDHRKSSLHRFIFEREFDSDSRAVLERQHTFETLSACDRYPELLELEREIIYLVTFFPMILYNRSVAPRLLEFNRAIHPFGYGGRHRGRLNDYHEKDIYMDYLKLNEKMFANDFPYKEKSDEFKVLCELCDVMDRLMLDIDLDAIIAAQDKELNEEIASEDVVRVFRELIGDGPVTRRAIADYLEKKRFEVLSDLRENPKIKLLQSVTAYCPSDHDILKKRKKSILKKFREVREAAEGRRDRQRREPITMRRLLELKGKIDIDHKCYETVDFLLQDFERALCDFDFSKGIGKKLTPQCVRNAVVAKMQELDALINELPPRSVFELDIEGIRPYVKSLIDYRRREFDERCERGFNDRIDTEDRDVNFVMCAGFLLDSEDKIKHYTDLLRSFDSVHCHQLANDLEKLIKDFMQAKKESSAPFYLCTGPRLFSAFNGFYEDSVKTKDMELRVLEERRAKMVASHPWVFNGPRGDLSQTCVEFMGYCGNLPASVDKARNFIDEFGWFKRNGEHNNYFDRLNRRESPQRVAADFFEKEVKNSPEFKEVREVARELVAIGGEADSFRKKHKIVFQHEEYDDYHGRRYKIDEKIHETIRQGNLWYLRRFLGEEFEANIRSSIENRNYGNEISQSIINHLGRISVFFMIGHMIDRQRQTKVEFNETGRIKLKDAWNLLKAKGGQVANDFVFDEGEQLKLLASPNMSGKTFAMKTLFTAVAWALATGHAPAVSAGMPVFDREVYLDRVMSKSDRNLSAFGNEAKFWIELFELFQRGDVFAVGNFDEIFSTTSPKYQAALTYAVSVLGFLKMGQCGMIASHNHDAAEALLGQFPAQIKGHHFAWHTKEKEGKPIFVHEYKMQPGNERSHAIEVARTLGLKPEILRYAEMVKSDNICA